MHFYHEPEPARGEPAQVATDVMRAVADNPSEMTYWGTNTYFLTTSQGLFVVDPGPAEDEKHLAVILAFVGERLAGIVVSHHHSDHFGLAPRIKAATGVPVYASSRFADDTFWPDVLLNDGDVLADYQVLHTPGHASDHLCFAREDGLVLTGDHVMTWNSSIVVLPDGDMADYCVQLQRMIDRDDGLYLPGHGPPLAHPIPYVSRLLRHRQKREEEILKAVGVRAMSPADLARSLYRKAGRHLAWAAERNVEAHLHKLEREGMVRCRDDFWETTG